MKGLSIENIAKCCDGKYIGSKHLESREVESISIDSREIGKDSLFIPIKGIRFDGHDAIEEVYKKGAICCLSEKELEDTQVPYILVKSTLQALKDIARFYREFLSIKVVGITGSVGKTSTKEMIASVVSRKFKTLKTQGNFNNEIGLPLTIFQLNEEHEVAVLEMGISDFGEMHELSKIAQPDICVITNIGDCHLENLNDRFGVLKAKTEIFDFIQRDGSIVLNGDDVHLASVTEQKGITPLFFGVEQKQMIKAVDFENKGLKGSVCKIVTLQKEFEVQIPIPGYHMVYNALAAAAVGEILGLSAKEIKAGIESLVPVGGRNNIIEADGITIIDDCYNANPVSMKASLDVLAQAEGRKIAVLGDMFELGERELQLHQECGRYAAEKGFDMIFCVGKLSEFMYKGALEVEEAKEKVFYIHQKEDLYAVLRDDLKENDTVLVKASNGMKFAEVVNWLVNDFKKDF